MTIYKELLERAYNGEKFSINFKTGTLKIGRNVLIDGWACDVDREFIDDDSTDVLRTIEEYYQAYKYSLPSERSDSARRKYFKALSISEIPDEYLFIAESREYARARLEGYILCSIANGKLKWNEQWGSFFWQSKTDADLIILRDWVEVK